MISPVRRSSKAVLSDVEGSIGGIWSMRLRSVWVASKYVGSVGKVVDGCDLRARLMNALIVNLKLDSPFFVCPGDFEKFVIQIIHQPPFLCRSECLRNHG